MPRSDEPISHRNVERLTQALQLELTTLTKELKELVHHTRDRNARIRVSHRLRGRIKEDERLALRFLGFARHEVACLEAGSGYDEVPVHSLEREVSQLMLDEYVELLLALEEDFKLCRRVLDDFVAKYQIPIPP